MKPKLLAPGGYPGGGYPGQPMTGGYPGGYPGQFPGGADPLWGYFSAVAGARDYSGKMGFNEFKELWTCLNQWRGTFYQYDSDRSGTVEPHELHRAIQSWGYNLSPQALNITVKRYSTDSRISFDNFIAIAVRLRLMTDHFRRRDATQTGHAQFTYDDFIQVSMYC
eukprot:gene14229-5249_t